MIIREVKNIVTNNNLYEYLNKNNVQYTFHTYFYKQCTVYKIHTDSKKHIKKIDEIMNKY